MYVCNETLWVCGVEIRMMGLFEQWSALSMIKSEKLCGRGCSLILTSFKKKASFASFTVF